VCTTVLWLSTCTWFNEECDLYINNSELLEYLLYNTGLPKVQTLERGIILLLSRSNSFQVQSTVVHHYSKKVGNVLVFLYKDQQDALFTLFFSDKYKNQHHTPPYHHKRLFFCSFPSNALSCPSHHICYLLGSVCNSQHYTLHYFQMHQYQQHCYQDTVHLFTFRTRFLKNLSHLHTGQSYGAQHHPSL
jgi:hypothetical protein